MSNDYDNKSKQEENDPHDDDEFEEMETDEDSRDIDQTEGELTDDTNPLTGAPHEHGGRRRVKIKKRIRIKKKTSSKRKYKKVFERIIWILFIVGFLTAVYILVNQLGITDEKYKPTKKRGMLLKPHQGKTPPFCIITIKQNCNACVNSI